MWVLSWRWNVLLQLISYLSMTSRESCARSHLRKRNITIGQCPLELALWQYSSHSHDLRQVICRYWYCSSPCHVNAYLPVTGMTMITKVVVHIRRPLLHWAWPLSWLIFVVNSQWVTHVNNFWKRGFRFRSGPFNHFILHYCFFVFL